MNLSVRTTASKALIVVDNKLLLQLRDSDPGILYPGVWGLFGGAVEPGEAPESALKRELKEELALWEWESTWLFDWKNVETNSCLGFFLVHTVQPFDSFILGEGAGMQLFTGLELKALRTTPDISANRTRIINVLRKF